MNAHAEIKLINIINEAVNSNTKICVFWEHNECTEYIYKAHPVAAYATKMLCIITGIKWLSFFLCFSRIEIKQ